MKKTLLTFLITLTWLAIFSQNWRIDSLNQALSVAKTDKDKVMLLCDLSYYYFGDDTDTSLHFAQQAYDLAQKIQYTQGEARALFYQGLDYRLLSDIPNSMQTTLRCIQLAEAHGFRFEAAFGNYNVGALYLDLLNDYPKALYYFKKASQWNTPVQDAWAEVIRLNLDISFGIVYERLNMPDSASYYYNEALSHLDAEPIIRPVISNFKGLLQLKLKNYPEALRLLREATAPKLNIRASAEIFFNLASCFREMGQNDSCVFYARKSLAEAEQIGYQQYVMKSATLLAEIYEGENKPDALHFYKIAKLASDAVYGEQKVRDLQRIITEEMQRQQDAEKERAAHANKVRQNSLLGGLASLLLIAFLLFRNNRQKQKSNTLLLSKNRELEIETALERVRSRTMAMHRSEELLEVVHLLYKEIKPFGVSTFGISIAIFREEENTLEYWFADNLDSELLQSYKVLYLKNKVLKQIWEAWQNKTPQSKVYLEGKEKWDYDSFILEETEFRTLPDALKQEMRAHKTACFTFTYFAHGYFESIDMEIPPEENAIVLLRFAKAFEQTYTRFLDLQKAEAQAWEAQIEAALERVRSRTMAMHRSEELGNVIFILFQQLTGLGIKIVSSWVSLMDSERNELTIWVTHLMEDAKPTLVKTSDFPTFEQEMQAWLSGQDISLSIPTDTAREIVKKIFDIDINPPGNEPFWYLFQSFQRYGYVGLSTWEPTSDAEKNIIARFSKVFEQTYTRFLDIQKAEAQAREAQIEAALERVRSRAIAMRHSDELPEAAEVLCQEFLKMGIESFSCGYLINDDEKQEWKIWLTLPEEPVFMGFWTCPYFADHNLRARYESWQRQEEFHCAVLEGEETRAHGIIISKYSPWKEALLDVLPPRMVFNSAHFSLGHLLIISPDRLAPELEQAMVRFAKVFDLAYRRFLDLEKAEARAREAKTDAALDRVRAEIASMRSAEDLERITPLVWQELITLEVPFFRCGVFIMDEENGRVHTYLSTPEGRSLAVMHLPFDSAETIRKTVEHWRKQKAYLDRWDKQQFVDWMQSLTEQGYIAEGNAYQGAAQPPEALALHFVPFKQGMLYVGHSEKLPEEQIVLLQRLADTFAVAYARYEDFSKLEVAKKQVESAFSELKSTQVQLIQSEKLASLGELTAGIAHEIQNPLNFVNNFSELSVGIAEDLKEEFKRPDKDEGYIEELLGDLTQNQQKINHHGKRAAAIVTGMLQHARTSTGKKEPTDLNALADEYLRLAYHGLRAKNPDFEATMVTDFDPSVGKVEVIPQDMGRVLLNLINNAFYAVHERAKARKTPPEGGQGGYQPTVTVSTHLQKGGQGGFIIRVKDNGTGVPDSVKAKIFQPFFTTKPTGQGTGLGLSLAYDIVTKGHGGTLEVETKEGEGTAFIIQLPAKNNG